MGYNFKKLVFAILGASSGLAALALLIIFLTVDLDAQDPEAEPLVVALAIIFGIASLILWTAKKHYGEKAAFYEQAKKKYPDDPWRQRESWASNEIIEWYPSQQIGLFFAYAVVLFVGGIITYFNINDTLLTYSTITWKTLLPIGVPLLLLPWAAKRGFLLLKRGPFKVQLADMPSTVGEPISGTITLNDGGVRLPEKLTVQLLCRKVRTHHNSSSNDKVTNRAEEDALWSEKTKLPISQPDADRNVTISFRFTPPDDLPPADVQSSSTPRIAWMLRLRDIYNKRMYDYAVELPVFEE
ncbi:hypothetical protein [Fodinibius halophilus]|uniref:Uncharacterized protein n=1 Tax=Fodinibius halophilus TaxID=1736908 RepID=A0A6M1T3Q6_9BACT|nr:hypothetical protein [Fodinibius halophilus]NGP88719.1 hypothetical protein [Fodinibius halophilus]